VTSLPVFRYHPDPVTTEMVTATARVCRCCGEARGVVYAGRVHAAEDLEEQLCPWCIADGSAARAFGAEFTDVGTGVPPGVPPEVLDELATRTVGFAGWQQEHWMYHCNDAAAFLGLAVDAPSGLSAVASVSTTYLFRCLHCPTELSYSDAP
jgi:uncharacterized protein CbrC (UPF0167 family)